jgi:hypothetical protein
VFAAVGFTGSAYTQTFDTLGSSTSAWTNDSTLAAWSLFDGTGAAETSVLVGDGATGTGSFYNFGTASAADRALGAIASGGSYFGSPPVGGVAGWMAVAVANNNNMMAGLNQYGTMMPQRLVYGNNNAANNSWMKPGAPRVTRTLPYTARRALRNNVSLHNFNSGNIGYLMFRGNVPVLYTAESLYGLIKSGPRKRNINSVNNLNHFLARVKNNKELFKNTGTRRPRTQGNIRKVKVSMNRAARVIQRKFRATRR